MTKESSTPCHDEEKHVFTKHIDSKGRFYHINHTSGAITYDFPHGIHVPLQLEIGSNSFVTNEKREDERIERENVIQLIRKKYNIDNIKYQKEQKHIHQANIDVLWKHACDHGRDTGVVAMNWKDLGGVSPSLIHFEENYGTPLKSLSLNGNGMRSITALQRVGASLERLSLMSNHIHSLDLDMETFQSLTYLNLSKNKLEYLPEDIGKVCNLKVLDLSNNKLVQLPKSIETLIHMKILKVNFNCLQEFPDVLDKMRLEEIHSMSNQLTILPKCRFSHLKVLLASQNRIETIPVEICESPNLEILQLSQNKIKEIPFVFCKLKAIRILWLDHNHLSALPQGFHNLINLNDLRLEGNQNMVHPPLRVIAEGLPQILKWCELHLARSVYDRKKTIVMNVQAILQQIGENQLCGSNQKDEPHESLFEQGVVEGDDQYYQLVFPAFWEIFLPRMEKIWRESTDSELRGRIRSFPYTRSEVESALVDFQDAAGKIFFSRSKLYFRQCCCRDCDGNRTPCSLQKDGYYCCRPGVLIRMELVSENIMVERRRKMKEEQRVHDAINATKHVYMKYLKSREGEEMLRRIAIQRLIENDPEKSLSPSYGLKRSTPKESAILNEMVIQLRSEYLQNEIYSKIEEMTETNRKIRKVLDAWIGITVEDIFRQWRTITTEASRQRVQQRVQEQLAIQMQQDELAEKIRAAELELTLWEKKFDEFNDVFYWEHRISGKTSDTCPSLQDLIDGNDTYPELSLRLSGNISSTKIKTCDVRHREEKLEAEALSAAMNILRRRKASLENQTSISVDRKD